MSPRLCNSEDAILHHGHCIPPRGTNPINLRDAIHHIRRTLSRKDDEKTIGDTVLPHRISWVIPVAIAAGVIVIIILAFLLTKMLKKRKAAKQETLASRALAGSRLTGGSGSSRSANGMRELKLPAYVQSPRGSFSGRREDEEMRVGMETGMPPPRRSFSNGIEMPARKWNIEAKRDDDEARRGMPPVPPRNPSRSRGRGILKDVR